MGRFDVAGRMGLMDFPKRGDLWIVNLDPTIGAEIKKRRPAVIISNDMNNQHASTVTVLPVTDKGKRTFLFEVFLDPKESGLKKASKIKCQQIRTVDKQRLIKSIGKVTQDNIGQIERALKIHLGIKFIE